MALLFLGVTFAQQMLKVLASYWSQRVAWTATNALRADLATHLVRLDLSFYLAYTPGELVARAAWYRAGAWPTCENRTRSCAPCIVPSSSSDRAIVAWKVRQFTRSLGWLLALQWRMKAPLYLIVDALAIYAGPL